MAHTIRFSDEADEHLSGLTAHQRVRILDAIEEQLQHEPTKTTRNRKAMRPDKTPFIAPWELRVGDLRVYYDVEEKPRPLVKILSIGVKVRNRVLIGDREIEP